MPTPPPVLTKLDQSFGHIVKLLRAEAEVEESLDGAGEGMQHVLANILQKRQVVPVVQGLHNHNLTHRVRHPHPIQHSWKNQENGI